MAFDWRLRGKCVKLSVAQFDAMFFPQGRSFKETKKFCEDCEVRKICLEFALTEQPQGIWAGTTEKERKAILKFRAKANSMPTVSPRRSGKKVRRNIVFS